MYIIGEKPDGETSVVKVKDRQEAESVVKKIVDQLRTVLNADLLLITRKEDDVIVSFSGKTMTTLKIREDDEIDLSVTNEQ